jgi:hypothetical protein
VSRLRFNNISGTAAGNGLTFTSATTTTGTWASAPAFPAIVFPDFAVVVVNPDQANEEIVYLTAYTPGATSGTFSRAQEGSTGAAHSGEAWVHGPTADDFKSAPSRVFASQIFA